MRYLVLFFNSLLIIKDYYIQFIQICPVHFIHFETDKSELKTAS
jgi:hypothetical protein